MTDKPYNPMAFPFWIPTKTQDGTTVEADVSYGMTLRDYFAGQAMTGLIGRVWENKDGHIPDDIFDIWATGSYEIADAMLKARAK